MACRKFRHTTQHGAIEKYRVIQDRLFESDFDNKPVEFTKSPRLKQRINTYRAKIRPLSDFIGIK